MEKTSYQFTKPYDLRERLFEFACAIVQLVQFLHRTDPVGRSLAEQVLRAGNSAGANYEEADDGSSPADTRSKRRICLRELKETLFRYASCAQPATSETRTTRLSPKRAN